MTLQRRLMHQSQHAILPASCLSFAFKLIVLRFYIFQLSSAIYQILSFTQMSGRISLEARLSILSNTSTVPILAFNYSRLPLLKYILVALT